MSGMVSGDWGDWELHRGGASVHTLPLTLQAARLPEPSAIPPREWLYATRLVRRFVTLLVAPGGTGKSLYAMGVAMALASGKPFLGEFVHHQVNAWVMNLEDPLDELDRRVAAMMRQHRLKREDLEGRLFLHSGRDRPLVLARKSDDGYAIVYPDKDAVIAGARSGNVGLIVVDPFVKSHGLEENSNPEMDAAATAWAEVGDATGAAILLVHHTRKGLVADIDSARGGKALTDAARVGLTMTSMLPEEAERLGIPAEDRWHYVRVDDQKVNMAPRADRAQWFELVTQVLGNGTPEYPHGDRVAALAAWEPPSVFMELSARQLNEALDAIDAGLANGGRYAPTRRGRANVRWCGLVLMDRLGVAEAQAARMVAEWMRSGLLVEMESRDPESRKTVAGVRVDASKRPVSEPAHEGDAP